jgi:hypothetical protein
MAVGAAIATYYWLPDELFDSELLNNTNPNWKQKVRQRNARMGCKSGFILMLANSVDSPALRQLCEQHGSRVTD